MKKLVVLTYNNNGEIVGVSEVKEFENASSLLELSALASKNREKDENEKQLELTTKEQTLNKRLNDIETRLKSLEIEQKYNRGELTEEEYNKEIEKVDE